MMEVCIIFVALCCLVLLGSISSIDVITTSAGTGTPGYDCDGCEATAAKLYWPYGIALDSSGSAYYIHKIVFTILTHSLTHLLTYSLSF